MIKQKKICYMYSFHFYSMKVGQSTVSFVIILINDLEFIQEP